MMTRLLTGVTRARTVVQRAVPVVPDATSTVVDPPVAEVVVTVPVDDVQSPARAAHQVTPDDAPAPSWPVPPVPSVPPVRASVIAPPRPAPGAGAADDIADGHAVGMPGADDAGDDADPGAGAGRGGFGRFLSPRGGDRAGFDVRNSWQIIAGSFLVPAGVVIILLAWYGAAHTRYVQQQIPYLVSGAFIGLGCMVLGGLLYWAHWLYRIYDQADLNHEEMMKAFEQTLRVVADRLTAGGPGSPAQPAPAAAPSSTVPRGPAPGGEEIAYVATATGSVYHEPSCPVVAHHGDGLRFLGLDDIGGMAPCRICLPRRATFER
jgi:hypothetical protein